MEKRIRKLKNNLAVSGMGTIAFGVWSAAKATMYVLLDKEKIFGNQGDYSGFVIALTYVFMYIFLAIDILIRYKAGRAAIRMGKGEILRSARPVVEGLIILVFSLSGIIFTLVYGTNMDDSYSDIVISAVIEISSLLAVAEMVCSAIMVEHLRKLQKKGSGV